MRMCNASRHVINLILGNDRYRVCSDALRARPQIAESGAQMSREKVLAGNSPQWVADFQVRIGPADRVTSIVDCVSPEQHLPKPESKDNRDYE